MVPDYFKEFANGLPRNSIIEYKHIEGVYTYNEALNHEGGGFTIVSLKDVYTFNSNNIYFGTFWCREVNAQFDIVYAMRLSISENLSYPIYMLPRDRTKLLMVRYGTIKS